MRVIMPVRAAAGISQLNLLSALQGLQMLNAAGYGREGSGLELDLVYNPNGAFLAPAQAPLEEAYRSVRLLSWRRRSYQLNRISPMTCQVYTVKGCW